MSRHRLGNVATLAILGALTPLPTQAQSGLLTRPIDLEPMTLSATAPSRGLPTSSNPANSTA